MARLRDRRQEGEAEVGIFETLCTVPVEERNPLNRWILPIIQTIATQQNTQRGKEHKGKQGKRTKNLEKTEHPQTRSEY